jgi:hypothetical protein
METELKETIQNLLLQFMQNMHEWEVMCNDIAKQSELSFEEQFNKQKELVSKIFLTYCTSRERKNSRPTTISYGNEGSYEYDVNEEKITDIVEEGKNRIAVHTYREVPLRQKKQYIFLYSKGKWLLDSKKRYSVLKQKWLSDSL